MVGVNAAVLFPKPSSTSTLRLATFRSNKTGLLGSREARFAVTAGTNRKKLEAMSIESKVRRKSMLEEIHNVVRRRGEESQQHWLAPVLIPT